MYPFWWDSTLPYPEFSKRVTARQTFVREAGHQFSAGYWMGEFGTGRVLHSHWSRSIEAVL